MKTLVPISLAAILGVNARYLLGVYVARVSGSSFPFQTLLINLTGSAALGFLAFWSRDHGVAGSWRLALTVGLCGTYTTFSTFAFESLALLQGGRWLLFALNVFANNALSILGVGLGMALARLR